MRTLSRPGPVLVLLAGLATVAAALLDLRVPAAHRALLDIEPGSTAGIPGLALAWGGSVLLASDRRSRLGWVLGGFGVWWTLDGLAASWLTYATLTSPARPGADLAFFAYQRLGAGLLLALPLILLLYPDGRLPRGRARLLALPALAACCALPLTLVAIPSQIAQEGTGAGDLPPPLASLDLDLVTLPLPDAVWRVAIAASFVLLAVSLLPVLALVVRRFRRAEGLDRVRMRWLLWAAVVDALVLGTVQVLPYRIGSVGLVVAILATVGAVVVGVTRPDLFDVDRLLGGTLLYGSLLVVTWVLDLAVLGLAGLLLGERLGSDEALVLAVFVVAVVYAPLRHRIWRLVRMRILGERDDPYAVVSGLAARLESSPTPEAQLDEVARAVATAFGVSYVGVEVREGSGALSVAEHGDRPDEVRALPIGYRDEQVGRLLLPARGVARLRRADEQLMADMVRQAATAARADRLARDLQVSRERLVTAVADERRRLRRELHDGLGPALAAVGTRIDTARLTATRNPEESARMLSLAREEVSGMLAEVRRLVHGLRPPALDDVGLVRALQQTADRLAGPGLEITVAAEELPALPAAVEVAAYRIVSEALTNVGRHADATHCTATLAAGPDGLRVVVRDDGRGIASDVVAGVGLVSLRERAEELGGRAEVRAASGGGTEVVALLPMRTQTLTQEVPT